MSIPTPLSRRAVLGTSAAVGLGLPLLGTDLAAAAPRGESESLGSDRRGRHASSTRAALRFLQQVTDAYRSSGPRLAQSYQDNSGLKDIGFIYDNALTTIALLAGGDTRRARAIGDALVFAQEHDEKFADGRLRQAYHVNQFVTPNGHAFFGWDFGLDNTAVGDMAWSGIALAQLARVTGERKYLTAAVRIGTWIQQWTYSTTGLGGYTFGEREGLRGHKSAEHNIDVYAFFRMLARLTGDRVWLARAEHAWDFVERVWNAEDGFFYAGSDDGSTINTKATQLPLDVQTWSWLAARKPQYAAALDWAAGNLATTDTPLRRNSALTGNLAITGVTFSSGALMADVTAPIDPWHGNPDDGAVWFEGTAQLADAFRDRHRDGDERRADRLLAAVRTAQERLGQRQTFNSSVIPGGIVAATSPLNTGFGFGYYPDLHIGATSWFVFAALDVNPYRFLRGR